MASTPSPNIVDAVDSFLAQGEKALAEAERLDNQVSGALPSGGSTLRSLWHESRAVIETLRNYADRAERLTGAPQARRGQELREAALAARIISMLLTEVWKSELEKLRQEVEAITSSIDALMASRP